MQITVHNDFQFAGGADINSFLADEQTAINILQSTFTDNISVVFDVGFGSYRGAPLQNQLISEADVNSDAVFFLDYSQLRQDLLTFGQPGFFTPANLPAATGLNGKTNFWVSSSVGACFGLFTNLTDGFVGIGNKFAPGGERISAFLHELGKNVGALVVDEVHLFDTKFADFLLTEKLALAAARSAWAAAGSTFAARAATAAGTTFTTATAAAMAAGTTMTAVSSARGTAFTTRCGR